MTTQISSSIQRAISWLKETATSRYGRMLIDFSIITVLAAIIFRTWLFTNEWPAGGDVSGFISRAYIFGKDFRWLYTWRPYSFGFTEGINAMDFLLMLVNSLFNNAPTTVKIFTLSSFLTAGFSMYGLTYHYTHRHIAALAGSMVYCLNQWIFSQYTEAHVDIIFSYALAPLVFLILVRALERRKLKDILGLAIALALLVTSFHPECLVIYGFFLLMFTVFYLLASVRTRNLRMQTKHVLKVVLPAVAVCLFLSAFLILPLILNIKAPYYSATFRYPIEDAQATSYANMTDAFTLRAVESWGYAGKAGVNVYTDLGLPDFPVYALLSIIFLLAFCTVFIRRNRYTIFFTFSIIISILIAQGPNSPLGYLFTWMWFNIPYFAVFRAASRANMMTAFSLAFLVSVLVSILLDYAQKRRRTETEVHLETKAKFAEENETREIHISTDALNKALRGMHQLFYYLSVLLLIFIFLSGFLSCFYFFSQGLQVYTPPESYIKPYDWLAKQSGDYKVITVANSPSQWMSLPCSESDFAYSAMLTNIGWSHDIGYDSSFIHDKPTLQDGGWNPLTRNFINYLRFRLVRRYLTNDILKMLGPFNYKYVVLPEYLANDTRNFFLNQQGYHIVYNQSSLILQNEYYTPRFFVPSQHVYVIGGLESYASLHKIDTFNLNQTALFFAYPTNETFLHSMFNSSEAIIFADSDITDAVMLSLKNHATFIEAANYGVSSLNFAKYWAIGSSWREVGGFVWGGNTLTTSGNNSVSIPIKIDSDGTYDIWIRIGFADNRGKLSILIDGDYVGEVQPWSKSWSKLMWNKTASLNLKSGEHKITLTNDGPGYNDLDMIAAVKPDTFQSEMKDVFEALQHFSGRIIYCLGGVNTFALDLSANWHIASIPYEDYVLSTESGVNANTNILVPRESDYVFALRLATGPDEGKVNLQVDNFKGSVDCSDANQGFSWKYFGPYHLEATNHTITIGGNGKIDFDEMIIYSLNQHEQTLSVDDLFKPKPAPIISYDQINPCKYTVHVKNSSAPFLLIFSELYDPMWKAYVENNEISPILMYSIVNGFYIDETGNFDVTIYFTGQTYADIGLKTSMVTLIIVVTMIVIPSKKLEELGKRIKHKYSVLIKTKGGCLPLR